jgi:hypothetical protein
LLYIHDYKPRKIIVIHTWIEALFKKIDWSYNGGITWDEFCTYMQLEYAEKALVRF